jgi:hypothetical protein
VAKRGLLLVCLFVALYATSYASEVCLIGKVVKAVFPDCFYIEEADKLSGIAVIMQDRPLVREGDIVTLYGVCQTWPSGERCFLTRQIFSMGAQSLDYMTLIMPNRAIGGASASPYTLGVTGGMGLNNIGLLVSTSGKVTRVESGRFSITDGHTTEIGVVVEGDLTAPAVGSYVLVTGVVTMDDTRNPMVRPQSAADVTDFGICYIPGAPMSTYGTSTLSTGTAMGSLSTGRRYGTPNDDRLPPILPPFYGQW